MHFDATSHKLKLELELQFKLWMNECQSTDHILDSVHFASLKLWITNHNFLQQLQFIDDTHSANTRTGSYQSSKSETNLIQHSYQTQPQSQTQTETPIIDINTKNTINNNSNSNSNNNSVVIIGNGNNKNKNQIHHQNKSRDTKQNSVILKKSEFFEIQSIISDQRQAITNTNQIYLSKKKSLNLAKNQLQTAKERFKKRLKFNSQKQKTNPN
jgi:hypothetical protein